LKIKIILVGKTDLSYIQEGWDEFLTRLKRYIPVEILMIPALKNTKNIPTEQQKIAEGKLIHEKLYAGDCLVLLDENGQQFSSVQFSAFLQQRMNSGLKNLVFVVGGPFGFSEEIYKKADFKMGLSKMTFTHQMVRLILIEQLYRAFTIIQNENYHH